jgi:hypothetical protein
MKIIQQTNMKKITQALLLATALTGISVSAMATSNQVSVTVKKIEGYGESGDAFTFKAVSGKRYMVYNAGGTSPIKGESLIQQSAKSKQKICLVLDSYPNEPRMVQAVKKGTCK